MIVNPLIKSLDSITGWLKNQGIRYMVFGGIANSIYGNPRQTFDIDIKVLLKSKQAKRSFIEELQKVGTIVPSNPLQFLEETNVLPVDVHGVRVDLVIAELPFEIEAIGRVQSVNFFGALINVCTPEDLIIQKAVSVREKDWDDIKYIAENLRHEMDWEYLLAHCRDLASLLDAPEIYNRIESWKYGNHLTL